MEGKAPVPGTTEQQSQQQTVAPTPTMQPAVNKVKHIWLFPYKIKLICIIFRFK